MNPHFSVSIATDRKDSRGKSVWRSCGVGFRHGKGEGMNILADTVAGQVSLCLFPIEYETGRPEKAPEYRVVRDTGRKTADGKTAWFECGVAFRNQRQGFNILLDTPGGEWRLFAFPVVATDEVRQEAA